MASSTDGDNKAYKVVQTCKDFLPVSPDIGLGDVLFAHALAQALYTGNLMYANASTPQNFPSFCFFESSPVDASQM
eukprot:7325639-Ditylum_brightwellii.AAC.1